MTTERADHATRFQPGHGHGAAAVEVRYARREARAAEMADQLPPLDSPENVRLSNELVRDAAFRGLIPGTAAGACIRAAEVALKALELETDLVRLRELEAKLAELEAERARERRVPSVRAL